MKIFYFYEFAGIEKKYQQNLIEVDEKVLKCLTFEHLQRLLIEDRANINENSVLCYFNQDKRVYVALKQGETIPISDQIKISIRGGFSNDISEFWQKLDSLAHQVQISEEKLEMKEKEQSKPILKKKSINSSYFDLDIAMVHAAPLACYKKYTYLPYEEGSLDFETEKKFLLENLAEGIGADLRFEAATTENLDELLEYMPKIIIISCQSYYDKTKKEFVLAFENHNLTNDGKGEIGLLYEMNTQNLKKILKASNQYSQIVIVKG